MSIFAHIISTQYSDSESFGEVTEFIDIVAEQAKALGDEEPAIILAEKLSIASQIPFFKYCQKKNVKAVFGLKVVIQGKNNEPNHELILVAKNNEGRENINRIITESYKINPEKGYKMISSEQLNQLKNGLIAISGGDNGIIERNVINNNYDKAENLILAFKKMFNNDFFLQIKRIKNSIQGKIEEEKIIDFFKEMSNKHDVKMFASNDVRFAKKEYYKHHLTRKAIIDKNKIYNPSVVHNETENQYLISIPEMLEKFKDIKSAVYNTGDLVDLTESAYFSNHLGKSKLPKFPIPEEFNDDPVDYLKHVTFIGFENRWKKIENRLSKNPEIDVKKEKENYINQINFELDVIEKTGFPGYFLIVHELVNWCKENKIPVGPGRGSGAGSLVLYSLNITDIDPIEHELLFERFLNPERMSEPDIDIDFSPKNRDRVINHMAELYGRENTAQILTESTMAPRSAVDSVGRVKGLLPYERDRIKNLISDVPGTKLKDELEGNEKLKNLYLKSRQVRRIIDEALIMEGSVTAYGKHAGGVVISLGGMEQYAGLYREEDKQIPVVQINKDLCESIGLIKFDILGLKNLDIIQETIDFINENKKDNEALLMAEDISFEDRKAINLFKNANTYGIFQFESPAMRRLMFSLSPDNFEEVVALVALFRPGPLQSGMAEDFVKRKFDKSLIKYPHEKLSDLLAPTYGTIIYQEQVMNIARVLAGFTLGQADILRKAMGKKIKEVMDQQRAVFALGCANNFREETKIKTKQKFKSKITGNNLEIDIDMSDINIPFIKELLKDSEGKVVSKEQVIEILKEYALYEDSEINEFSSTFEELDENDFFRKNYSRLLINGTKKLKEEGLDDIESEKIISRLMVSSGIFLRFNKIFSLMDKFAAYGFNKSHSVAYAAISMQTAYLKAHYPSQYMSSILSNEKDLTKLTETAFECRRMGIKILRPDINESKSDFKALSSDKNETQIRYGLGAIKGMKKSIEHIIKIINEKGKLKDIYDFYDRFNGVKIKNEEEQPDGTIKVTNSTLIGKKAFSTLINSGALDSLCPNQDPYYRPYLLSTYYNIEDTIKEVKKILNDNFKKINTNIKKLNINDLKDLLNELNIKDEKHFKEFLIPENISSFNKESINNIYMKLENKFDNKLKLNLFTQDFKEMIAKNTKSPMKELEVNGIKAFYKIPDSSVYKEVPEYGTAETAFLEFDLTGMYQTINPLELNKLNETLSKDGFSVSAKDLPNLINELGTGKNRKYFDTKFAGTVIDVKDFKRFDENKGENVTNITVTLDDGTGVLDIKFNAEELFVSGKEQKGIDLLKSMCQKEVLMVEGAATNGLFESAGIIIYANNIGSANKDIYLPLERPDLNVIDFKPASEGQIKFVKSLLNQNNIKFEDYLRINNVSEEKISHEMAQEVIAKYANKKNVKNRP